MPKVTFVQPSGEQQVVEIMNGTSVMEGAVDNNIDGVVAACGGCCSCSTCHVYVDPRFAERVGQPDEAEQDVLEFAIDPDQRSRLSCQLEMSDELDGLIVHVPAEQA